MYLTVANFEVDDINDFVNNREQLSTFILIILCERAAELNSNIDANNSQPNANV